MSHSRPAHRIMAAALAPLLATAARAQLCCTASLATRPRVSSASVRIPSFPEASSSAPGGTGGLIQPSTPGSPVA